MANTINMRNPLSDEQAPAPVEAIVKTSVPTEIQYHTMGMDIFGPISASIHPYYRRIQLAVTGLSIGLLILIVAILILARSSAKNETETVQKLVVMSPSFEVYTHLFQKYPQTLECSCSQVAIPHQAFISLTYSLHPICSSVFVTQQWLDFIGSPSGQIFTSDFRAVAPLLFQGLRSLCSLAGYSIQNALLQFSTQVYHSPAPVPGQQFSAQSDAIVQQFIQSTTSNFLQMLAFIGETSQANGFLSAVMTNYFLVSSSGSPYINAISTQYDGNCDCRVNSACSAPSVIFLDSSGSSTWNVPGFRRGCFVLNALYQSHLGCFFNQSCVNSLRNLIQPGSPQMFTALNSSMSVRFSSTTPIGDMLEDLMVNEWRIQVNYAAHYNHCAPKSCSYEIMGHDLPSKIDVLTKVLGTIGGIAAILNLMVFITTAILFEIIRRRSRKTTAAIHPVQTIQVPYS